MGTHPIFESDFDCLTDLQRKGIFGSWLECNYHCNCMGYYGCRSDSCINGTCNCISSCSGKRSTSTSSRRNYHYGLPSSDNHATEYRCCESVFWKGNGAYHCP